MIEKLHNEFMFECDECGAESQMFDNGDAEDFAEAIRSIKNDGWEIWKDENIWTHFCSDECRRQYKKTNK